MLSDRSYLRSDYSRRTTSGLVWLIASLIAAYLLELVLSAPRLDPGSALINQLPLTVRSLQTGRVWTLLTHSFLHSPTNPGHILFTILGLIFIGRELEPLLGSRRFLGVYAGALLLGALGWTAVHWSQGGMHLGASAGVLGLFVVLAGMYPDHELTFPLLFLCPVTLRPRHLVYGLLAVDLFALFFLERSGSGSWLEYAPSAHLGGMLAGWIYFRFLHANNGWDRAATITLSPWRQRPKIPAQAAAFTPNPDRSSTGFRAEVDRILDKINSQGFGALTEEEKRLLDEAKDLLSRP
jgi:membrane associated rhomboid family serine protease